MTYHPRREVPCVICGAKSVGRKLCRRHYQQAWVAGTLDKHPILGPQDVFDSRYVKRSSGCWEWTGTTNGYGYGIFLMPGEKPIRAHRFSYERANGAIPDGLCVMHTCDNPPCVNPAHLRLGTKDDNNRDMREKRRHRFGDRHHWTRLSKSDVQSIKRLLANGKHTQIEIARRYGVDPSTMSNISTGKRRPEPIHA